MHRRPPVATLPFAAVLFAVLLGCGEQTSERTRLETDPHPFDAVLGPTWAVSQIGAEPSLEGSRPTLSFRRQDHHVAAFTGLNRVQARWSFEGSGIRVTEVGATEVAGPPPLEEQDAAFLEALPRVTTWRVADGSSDQEAIELLGRGQEVLFVLRRE